MLIEFIPDICVIFILHSYESPNKKNVDQPKQRQTNKNVLNRLSQQYTLLGHIPFHLIH